ncbi:MAG: hypothetical protein K5837_03700 [Candidatus Saccharibacteria bacterium]|nr:hypothetical protein [Candidatus Saccharibacteria bacterium]
MCRYKIATLVRRVVRERDGVHRYRSSVPGLPLATYELLEEVCDAIEFAPRKTQDLFAREMAGAIEQLFAKEHDSGCDERSTESNFIIRVYALREGRDLRAVDIATITNHLYGLLLALSNDDSFCLSVCKKIQAYEVNDCHDGCCLTNYGFNNVSARAIVPDEIVDASSDWCLQLKNANTQLSTDWLRHLEAAIERRIVQVLCYYLDDGSNSASVVVDDAFILSTIHEIVPSGHELTMPTPPLRKVVYYSRVAGCSLTC